MRYPKDRIIKCDEARKLLEQEFRNRILKKYPDIDASRFMDLVEAFLRGYDKGIGVMHNIFYPNCQVCVFDEDLIPEKT